MASGAADGAVACRRGTVSRSRGKGVAAVTNAYTPRRVSASAPWCIAKRAVSPGRKGRSAQ